jgi:hypothetical protein
MRSASRSRLEKLTADRAIAQHPLQPQKEADSHIGAIPTFYMRVVGTTSARP